MELFPRFRSAELGLTITTMDSEAAGVFEPHAPAPKARLRALEKLHDEGFSTYAFIGPVLPGITELEELVQEIAPITDKILFEDLNMGPARREIMAAVSQSYPELEALYKNLNSRYWQKVEGEIRRLAKKYSFTAEIYFKHTGALNFRKKGSVAKSG
jgi:DNA repair photolyase